VGYPIDTTVLDALWTNHIKDGNLLASVKMETLEQMFVLLDDLVCVCTGKCTDDREKAAIVMEGRARQGEVALAALMRHPATGVRLWQQWTQACPHDSRTVFKRLTS
jgi:hypothetical protein